VHDNDHGPNTSFVILSTEELKNAQDTRPTMQASPITESVDNELTNSVFRTMSTMTTPPLPPHLFALTRGFRIYADGSSSAPSSSLSSFAMSDGLIPEASRYSPREPSADLIRSAETAAMSFSTRGSSCV